MIRVHGLSSTRAYLTWQHMKRRCLNPKLGQFKDYGGRGITICERWMRFGNFFADMGERPKGKTLDRIDNNGNYEPGNCRWATKKEQQRNMRSNRLVTINGATMCAIEWAEISGTSPITIITRLGRGWDSERAVFQPAVPTRCKRGHSFDVTNTFLDKRGRRNCRRCLQIRHKRWYDRNKKIMVTI